MRANFWCHLTHMPWKWTRIPLDRIYGINRLCAKKRNIPADHNVQAVVDQYLSKLEEGMKEVIGELDCELEGRFSELRTRETNLGNLITDIMRRATRADAVALINSEIGHHS